MERSVIQKWVPLAVADAYRLARSATRYPSCAEYLRRNRAIRNSELGRSVVIVGNGPSMRGCDWRIFDGLDLIVMNLFNKGAPDADLRLVAHCFGEPTSSAGWSAEEFVESINEIPAYTHWVHYSAMDYLKGLSAGKQVHCVLPGWEGSIWSGGAVRLDRISLGYVTTAQLAIQVAMYLGYRKIALVGFDHDWLASPKYSRHFYSDQRDANDKLHTFQYEQILRFMTRMWGLYRCLQISAVHMGIDIRNATDGGFLDVFRRLELEKIREFLTDEM